MREQNKIKGLGGEIQSFAIFVVCLPTALKHAAIHQTTYAGADMAHSESGIWYDKPHIFAGYRKAVPWNASRPPDFPHPWQSGQNRYAR